MRVFIVSHGTYSDYGIDGVFSTQQEAIQYIDKESDDMFGEKNIELWEDSEELIVWEYDSTNQRLEQVWGKRPLEEES